MGSSSKDKGRGLLGLGGSAKPQMQNARTIDAAGRPTTRSIFANSGQLPAQGGLMRPTAIPGQPQGAAMNWMMPTANASAGRNNLAQTMRQRWGDEVLFGSQPGRGYGEGKSRGWGGSMGMGGGGHV